MEVNLKKAKEVYDSLCEELTGMGLRYKKVEEDLALTLAGTGDDIPMEFVIKVDADRQLVRLMSMLPFTVPEEKYGDIAAAVCQTNYRLADGSFDLHLNRGKIMFKMTSSFRNSLISGELLKYMIQCAIFTVDKYNDQYLMITKGALTLDKFLNG